jgi:hypothetical protein
MTSRRGEPSGSPIPGVIPEPIRVHDEGLEAEQRPGTAEPAADSGREARRAARSERREGHASEARAEQSGVMIPNRRKRLPLEAPLMRLVATAGIVGISVAIGAIMTSQHAQGWVTGLVVSVVSLVLAAVLWSTRRL